MSSLQLLRKKNYLVVQSGSVDISNLKTKNQIEKYFDYFSQQAVVSATNIFSAFENALKIQPNIAKVVIMKQIPCYDRANMDTLAIKQALSQVFNNTMTDLWLKSQFKHKIFVGNHNLECEGGIRESRYKNIMTGAFDGIHLLGSSGGKYFTQNPLNILKLAGLIKSDFYHQNCAQSQYQAKQRGFKKKMSLYPVNKNVRKPADKPRLFRDTYSIPLANRFAGLPEEFAGNF